MLCSECTSPHSMKLFLDTANLKEIETIASWGILDGVTTNPSLLSKEGKVNPEKHLKAICKQVVGPVSMEVISTDAKGMIEEGKKFAKWAENIVVKVPMTKDGLVAVTELKKFGIPTNVTLIFTANQALLAAKAGARFVSPFIGRLDDIGEDGLMLISELVQIFDNYAFETEILVASVRSPRQITEVARMGADVATLPFAVFEKLLLHPLTDAGIEKFLKDWKSTQQ